MLFKDAKLIYMYFNTFLVLPQLSLPREELNCFTIQHIVNQNRPEILASQACMWDDGILLWGHIKNHIQKIVFPTQGPIWTWTIV